MDAGPAGEDIDGCDGVFHPPWTHQQPEDVEGVVSVVSQCERMDDRVEVHDHAGEHGEQGDHSQPRYEATSFEHQHALQSGDRGKLCEQANRYSR